MKSELVRMKSVIYDIKLIILLNLQYYNNHMQYNNLLWAKLQTTFLI